MPKPKDKNMERTFLAIKPDGVQRGLVGNIIQKLESKGFQLVGLKMTQVSRELAEKHYAEHSQRPFFPGLVDFITSAPVIAMVWEGKGVIATSRKMIGKTNPLDADNGTIRGDYGVDVGRNIIHGSDSTENSDREISLWFKPEELTDWSPASSSWIYE
jgi:nucleoside-diphosphate kinase